MLVAPPPPAASAGKLAGDAPFFRIRFNLSLKFLILGVKMFTLHPELLELCLGFPNALLPQISALLQVVKSAFEQLQLILNLLAFRFPPIATGLEECNQFPRRT